MNNMKRPFRNFTLFIIRYSLLIEPLRVSRGAFLVEMRRVELLSESPSKRISTSLVGYFSLRRFPRRGQTDTPLGPVGCNTPAGHSHRPQTFTTSRRLYPSRGTLRQDGLPLGCHCKIIVVV